MPSVATIWRVLSRRGLVVAQPHKRPSSWRRFQAELRNACWQADTTHWSLAEATPKNPQVIVERHHRVRRDRIDKSGCVTLRYRSKLLHIGVGRVHAGVTVLLLVHDLDVRVITERRAIPAPHDRPDQDLPTNRPPKGPARP